MKKLPPKTMQPSDFQVNRTWLAYRINQSPMLVEGRPIDLYVLQDAASMFLFGNAFAAHGSDCDVTEVERLMESARVKKDEWPSELIMPGTQGAENSFAKVACKNGVAVRTVPESQVSFYIKDAQEAYEEFFSRGSGDA